MLDPQPHEGAPGDNDAQLDMEILAELAADREAYEGVHAQVLAELEQRGVATDMISDPYAGPSQDESTLEAPRTAESLHAVAMLGAVGAVAEAIRSAQVTRETAGIMPASEGEPDVEVEAAVLWHKAYATLAIGYEKDLESGAAAALRDILNTHVPVAELPDATVHRIVGAVALQHEHAHGIDLRSDEPA